MEGNLEGNLKVKITDGKIDLLSFEGLIKKILQGYVSFSFDHTTTSPGTGRILVTAKKPDTPRGMVEAFIFSYSFETGEDNG